MKLTSQEEYGLRCLLTLSRQAVPGVDRPSMTLSQIAEKECMSNEYAGKLMGVLTRAGLAESVRGRYGGYRLKRPADETSVADVLLALGGLFYRDSQTCERFTGDQDSCVHSSQCSIRSLWSGLQMLIDHVLQRTTLSDLVTIEEANIAGWMQSHLEALTDLVPLAMAPDNSAVQKIPFANVVIPGPHR